MKKHWENRALELLKKSLEPLPQELNEIDWKVDFSEKGDRMARHLSALANYSEGGFLVFGVDDEGEKKGINSKSCTEIVKKIGNIVRDGLEPPIIMDTSILEVDTANLLFVFIKESDTKPVHLRGNSIYEAYTRSAGQTRKLTKQEVARMISSSTGLTFETKLASSAMRREEIVAKLDFSIYFDLLKKPLPSSTDAIIETLLADKLIKRAIEGFYITNLGAILLAKQISDFEELQRRAVRVIQYRGKDRLERTKEITGQKGYASGFVSLINYISALLPTNELIKESLRRETKLYPSLSLRELIANALIHQDFETVGSGPVIEIFEDRIEIRNPGKPLVKTERFLDYPPRSRNEQLASMMRRFGVCEELGTGIDKIVSQCEMYQLPAPNFVVEDDHLIATLYAPRVLTKMNKADRIRACYLHACLKYVSNEVMTNASVRTRFKISKANYPLASKIIAEALEAKAIKQRDPSNKSRKHAQYIPVWA